MSITVDPFALPNPNPNPSSTALLSRRASTAFFSSPASLRFEPLLLRPPSRASMAARPLYPWGLGLFPLLHRRGSGDRLVFAFSASHEESKSSDIEVEEVKNDLKSGAEESQEAWKQALASFKEQSLKMKSVSQEAYELYSKKAMVILKETSEQLKIQAEKARYDLSVIVKEISEESKEYLSTAAESSPGPVKDIVETFASSTDDIKEISEVRDFYLGIPYGILLSFGGFLSFMLTGSVSAIRFGVILGGTLLALSISSLRSWKKGESFHLALKGQAAITSILFVREISLLYRRPSFVNCFTSLISGAVVVFYLYRITLEGGQANASSLEHGTEN